MSESFERMIREDLARAYEYALDGLVAEAFLPKPAPVGTPMLDLQKIAGTVVISDQLLHPENYAPKVWPELPLRRRIRYAVADRWWRSRRAVGFWIAGEHPSEDY